MAATLFDMPEADASSATSSRDVTIDAMMAMIREDLAALNVHHDVFFSESGRSTPETAQKSSLLSMT